MHRCNRFSLASRTAVATLFAAAAVHAQEADPATGRWLRQFAPEATADILHTRLDLRVEDLAVPEIAGTATIRFRPVLGPLNELALDATGLAVTKVTRGEREAKFQLAGNRLTITLNPAASGDDEVCISYSAHDPAPGMIFAPGRDAGQGPQLHTQGESDSNDHWFPCHDFPNERMTSELVVNVPKGIAVSGNGRLVAHTHEGDREVWHWLQDKPHVAYLVSLVAGPFERVTLPNPLSGVPMQVWVPPHRADDVLRTYAATDRMIVTLERAFGMPYPWARYDQLLVRNFGAGGMENTSATSLADHALVGEDAEGETDFEALISHELCHQWTGDLITCRTWEHIWLNEGWATYGENLWFEERDGPDGYFDEVLDNTGVAGNDSVDGTIPMCSNLYNHPGECFGRAGNPYPKGASILHMLRELLGDEAFFAGVRGYFAQYALDLTETDDFRRSMEDATGRSLEWFFDQWCLRPGTPRVKVTHTWDESTRTLKVNLEQTQRIDAMTPAFRCDLPVVVATSSGVVEQPVRMTEKTQVAEFHLDGAPQWVCVDPRVATLKVMETDFPAAWLAGAARSGPTMAAKRLAARELGARDEEASRVALSDLARDAAARWTLRREAVQALARHPSAESKAAVLALWGNPPVEARVRKAVVEAIGTAAPAGAFDVAVAAITDRSPGVRSAAAGAIGSLASNEAVIAALGGAEAAKSRACELLTPLLSQESTHDSVRRAAMEACGQLKCPGSFTAIEPCAQLGMSDRTRAMAVRTLGGLAEADPALRPQAIALCNRLVDDLEWRVPQAAGDVLVALVAEDSLAHLDALAKDGSNQRLREQAGGWASGIREKVAAREKAKADDEAKAVADAAAAATAAAAAAQGATPEPAPAQPAVP